MKTNIWLVVLWHRGKVVAGDSLQHLIKMNKESLQTGEIPTACGEIASLHTSASAADKAAAKLAEHLKSDGWWLAEGSAQNEELQQDSLRDDEQRKQEGEDDES